MKIERIFQLIVRIICFALALSICAPQLIMGQQTSLQTPPVQKRAIPSTRYIPSHDYDQRNITLNLHFNWEFEQAIGTATITFAPLIHNLREVEFDAAQMTINSVKLSSGTQLKYENDASHEKLHITLDRSYQPNDVITIAIDYHTNGVSKEMGIGGFGRGLTFIKPRPNDQKRPRQIWSQGETEYNHYWFPCYDHPNDFATTEIIATVEKPLMVISNGKLIKTKENSDGTRTFDWKIEQPHATYLTSIVVGEYVAIEGSYAGIPVISYVYPNESKEGKSTTSRLPEMVKFFSEVTGVKYPYAKYAQTMVRDFGGGMENISATTQTDTMILDERTELDRDSDGLQSHELAHQWFGDYVTCREWSDIWLNESFATYFQALWDEHRLGHDDFLYTDVKGNQDQYYAAWARGQRRPIVTKNYANPDSVFDTYSYPRGGAVLHMLKKTLGDENWWRAINHYLTKYAYQPVETEQFRIAIEEATGQSMDWFFDEWLYKMGHPVFRVTQGYDPQTKTLSLTIKQEQKPDPASDYPQATLFRTPVEIEIGTASNTRVERAMIEPKEEQTFTYKVDAQPLLVNFDYGNTLIKQLRFDKTTDELVYQLKRDEDVMGRMWALGQLSDRLKSKAGNEEENKRIVAAISEALTNDKFWGVRLESAATLNGMNDTVSRAALLTAVKDRYARVRARAITSLSSSKDPALASVYEQALNDQSYSVIRRAANALGQTKSANAYQLLTKLLDTPSWRDQIRASALTGLAALEDPRALEVGLRYAAAGNTRGVRGESLLLLSVVGKKDPRSFPVISEALVEGAQSSDFALLRGAAEALVALNDTQRTLETIKDARQKAANNPGVQQFLEGYEQRLLARGKQ